MRKAFFTMALTVMTCTCAFSAKADTVNAKISVDGDSSDWAGITGNSIDARGTIGIENVKFAYSEDGSTLYICYTGTTLNQWSSDFKSYHLTITNDAGTNDYVIGNMQYYPFGAKEVYVNEANGNTSGSYTMEIAIDAAKLGSNPTFTLAGSTGSYTVANADIPTIDGNAYVEPEKEPAVYEGITIDGDFSDWDAVAKTEAGCPNPDHSDCIDAVAAVFDGDYLYLYVEEKYSGSACGAGSHSNGMYSVVTDLGRNMVLQLNSDGTVSGLDGVTSNHYGRHWEIAIPASDLPYYDESLTFGLYQTDPFITDIVNIQEDDGNASTFTGVVYDGLYGDWQGYPHTLIEYATAGTTEVLADGEQALYSDGDIMYGHVVSPMLAHTTQSGHEMTSAITFRFNEDNATVFSPRLIKVDEQGNIDWDTAYTELDTPGTYEYYLVDMNGWSNYTNISEFDDNNRIYGKMMITSRGEGQVDDAEYYLDLAQISKKFGFNEGDIKIIQSRFGKIGDEYATCAGTSSGAVGGVALCLGVVGLATLRKKFRI